MGRKSNEKYANKEIKGERLKKARKKAGLTQEKLAELMGFESTNTISKIERGDSNLTNDNARIAAKILNVDEEYLRCEQDFPSRLEKALSSAYGAANKQLADRQNAEAFIIALCKLKHVGRLGYSKNNYESKYAVLEGEPQEADFVEAYKIIEVDGKQVAVNAHEYYRLQREIADYIRFRFNDLFTHVPIETIWRNEKNEIAAGFNIDEASGTAEQINYSSDFIVEQFKELVEKEKENGKHNAP